MLELNLMAVTPYQCPNLSALCPSMIKNDY